MNIIGRQPNQVPTNAMLGRCAFLDRMPSMSLIATAEVLAGSPVAAVDFIGLRDPDVDEFMFTWQGVVPVSNADTMIVRSSANDGSTFDAGGTDYYYNLRYNTVTVPAITGSGAQTASPPVGLSCSNNAAHGGAFGRLFLRTPSNIVANKFMQFNSTSPVSGTDFYSIAGAFMRASTGAISGMRFAFATSNIAQGKFKMYAINHKDA